MQTHRAAPFTCLMLQEAGLLDERLKAAALDLTSLDGQQRALLRYGFQQLKRPVGCAGVVKVSLCALPGYGSNLPIRYQIAQARSTRAMPAAPDGQGEKTTRCEQDPDDGRR